MLAAIEKIQTYTADIDEIGFLGNGLIQDAVLRNLEIIGEAAANIRRCDSTFEIDHPDFPLSEAYALRNWITHGYFKVDLHIIWKTLESDLPELERQLLAILA